MQHATWIHDMRMNVHEKFKIRIVQMLFSPELHTCESEELKHREKEQHHDFLHEIITHYKNNQVNAWFKRNTTNFQLNNLEQHPSFTWRSEQTNIDGINGYI